MGRIVGALLCVVLFAVSSCYSAPNPACGFLCNSENGFTCPQDYTCSHASGVCVSSSASAGTRCFADAAPAPEGIDADPTAPAVLGTSPENGDTGVPQGSVISVTFSQAIAGFGSSTVLVTDGGTQVATTLAFDATSKTLTITPVVPLNGSSPIRVTLTGLTNTGPLHVPLADYSFAFTTADTTPPQLALSSPLDMATAVPVTTTVVATFDEPVMMVVQNASFSLEQGATTLPGTVASNTNGTVWTFTPNASLPAASVITVLLTTDITDLSGNHLGATMFTFTTQ